MLKTFSSTHIACRIPGTQRYHRHTLFVPWILLVLGLSGCGAVRYEPAMLVPDKQPSGSPLYYLQRATAHGVGMPRLLSSEIPPAIFEESARQSLAPLLTQRADADAMLNINLYRMDFTQAKTNTWIKVEILLADGTQISKRVIHATGQDDSFAAIKRYGYAYAKSVKAGFASIQEFLDHPVTRSWVKKMALVATKLRHGMPLREVDRLGVLPVKRTLEHEYPTLQRMFLPTARVTYCTGQRPVNNRQPLQSGVVMNNLGEFTLYTPEGPTRCRQVKRQDLQEVEMAIRRFHELNRIGSDIVFEFDDDQRLLRWEAGEFSLVRESTSLLKLMACQDAGNLDRCLSINDWQVVH